MHAFVGGEDGGVGEAAGPVAAGNGRLETAGGRLRERGDGRKAVGVGREQESGIGRDEVRAWVGSHAAVAETDVLPVSLSLTACCAAAASLQPGCRALAVALAARTHGSGRADPKKGC